ncbi:MAG TPA: SRPBCC family protein [Gammaproteobacteria bacterium]
MSSNRPEEGGSPRAEEQPRREIPYGSEQGPPLYDDEPRRPRSGVALPGRRAGREGWSGAQEPDSYSKFLGWFSVGLGTLGLVAPRVVARAIGVQPTPMWNGVLRFFGARELANGAGILANPRSKEWVGMRVGGDALDLATLGVAMTQTTSPSRTLAATAFVLGAAVFDLVGTERLAERRKAPTREYARYAEPVVLRSITVGRPVNEVYAYWKDFANFPRFMQHVESIESLGEGRSRWRATGPAGTRAEWTSAIVDDRPNELIAWQTTGDSELYHSGKVTFRPGPRGDGTVVTVEMQYAPPGGQIGAALLKLFRREPGQQVIDDLRRFKQVMEIGEVVQSDASIEPGVAAARPHERRDQPQTVH